MLHTPVRPRASFASLLLIDECGELRSAPHAVRQGAPAREAMPQKTTARQAPGSERVLKTFGIVLNPRRKIFGGRKRKTGCRCRQRRRTRQNLRKRFARNDFYR